MRRFAFSMTVCALIMASSTAWAGFTTIHTNSGELSLTDYLNTAYGTGWTRIDDDHDQVFSNFDRTSIQIKAKVSSNTLGLGYSWDTVNGTHPSYLMTGLADSSVGATAVFNPNDNSFVWALHNGDTVLYSLQDLNPCDTDYMVSFQINDNTYVYAFEDWVGGDYDYQDLVIEVQTGSPAAVPAPGALLLSAIGTSLAGFFKRRRSQ